MEVVREADGWRLCAVEEGVYEVRRDDRVECKIVTADYEPAGFVDAREDISVPVREVDAPADAETVFEAMVATGRPPASGPNDDPDKAAPAPIGDVGPVEDLLAGVPLWVVPAVGLPGGALALAASGFDVASPAYLVGIALLVFGSLVAAVALYRLLTSGPDAALDILR